MKVTLDTNILISGTFWTGDSFKILNLIDTNKIKCVLSEEILKEYNKVINSEEIIDKVENKKLITLKIIEKVISNSIIIEPKIKINISEDPDDNKVLECAIEGSVDYIITNDAHLLKIKEYKGIKIINSAKFIKILR